jgi:prophage regulatory protein
MELDRFISKKELRTLVLYSPAHIDRLEKAGLFPKRVRLGNYPNSRVGWRESAIRKWMEEREARSVKDQATNISL